MATYENKLLEKKLSELSKDPSRHLEQQAVTTVRDLLDHAVDLAHCVQTQPSPDFLLQIYDRLERELLRLGSG